MLYRGGYQPHASFQSSRLAFSLGALVLPGTGAADSRPYMAPAALRPRGRPAAEALQAGHSPSADHKCLLEAQASERAASFSGTDLRSVGVSVLCPAHQPVYRNIVIIGNLQNT